MEPLQNPQDSHPQYGVNFKGTCQNTVNMQQFRRQYYTSQDWIPGNGPDLPVVPSAVRESESLNCGTFKW